MDSKTTEYWNSYYDRSRAAGIRGESPSQFAAFVSTEYPDADQIVELGCGSGRDSLFFARLGRRVLGLDGSVVAIEKCRSHLGPQVEHQVAFEVADLSHPAWADQVRDRASVGADSLIYARFFLHAVDEATENVILDGASALSQPGTVLALEFRTIRDNSLPKVTPDHYRRFIDPIDLINKAVERGFRLDYFVEGFGYAKYKSDDAHVARCVFRKK